jgi:hypothetical protein
MVTVHKAHPHDLVVTHTLKHNIKLVGGGRYLYLCYEAVSQTLL